MSSIVRDASMKSMLVVPPENRPITTRSGRSLTR